jgi:hypothetical protein
MSKDYEHLIALLDEGKEVVVTVQLYPSLEDRYAFLAHSGIMDGRKFYTVGYGFVFDKEALIRQCEAMKLEYIGENDL